VIWLVGLEIVSDLPYMTWYYVIVMSEEKFFTIKIKTKIK